MRRPASSFCPVCGRRGALQTRVRVALRFVIPRRQAAAQWGSANQLGRPQRLLRIFTIVVMVLVSALKGWHDVRTGARAALAATHSTHVPVATLPKPVAPLSQAFAPRRLPQTSPGYSSMHSTIATYPENTLAPLRLADVHFDRPVIGKPFSGTFDVVNIARQSDGSEVQPPASFSIAVFRGDTLLFRDYNTCSQSHPPGSRVLVRWRTGRKDGGDLGEELLAPGPGTYHARIELLAPGKPQQPLDTWESAQSVPDPPAIFDAPLGPG